jgi:hypothetical protein
MFYIFIKTRLYSITTGPQPNIKENVVPEKIYILCSLKLFYNMGNDGAILTALYGVMPRRKLLSVNTYFNANCSLPTKGWPLSHFGDINTLTLWCLSRSHKCLFLTNKIPAAWLQITITEICF